MINALTDRSHPCQVLADLMTIEEVGGELTNQHVVYIGDGNNIASSLIEASALAGFALTVITPPGYDPQPGVVERARSIDPGSFRVTLTNKISLDGATAIYTDVWASMGQEDERDVRQQGVQRLPGRPGVDGRRASRRLHALPARASRRGGDRRGHRRAALGRLPAGRQPPLRADGPDGRVCSEGAEGSLDPAVLAAARRGHPPCQPDRARRRGRGGVRPLPAAPPAAWDARHPDPRRSHPAGRRRA